MAHRCRLQPNNSKCQGGFPDKWNRIMSMFQCGQHPVFSTQTVIHRKVTSQLPECHHNYMILHLSSEDQPPITYFWDREESDVWNVCRVCMQGPSRLARSINRGGSSRLPLTPQSSKINLLASWLFTWPYNPNSWLQWESALHTDISKLYGAQNATAQYLRSPLVKCCVF